MPRRTKPGVNWAKIRERAGAGQSTTSLAKEHGVARQSIDKRADKEGWGGVSEIADPDQIDWKALALQTNTAMIYDDPQTLGQKHMVTVGCRSPEIMANILKLVSEGASPNLAVQACGLSESHVTKWKQQDESFKELLRIARGVFLTGQQRNIAKASKRGDWKAAQAMLQAAPETRKDWSGNNAGAGGITVNIAIRADGQHPTVDIATAKDDEE